MWLFGSVPMADAGAGAPVPLDRRFSAEVMWSTTEDILDMGVRCDELGYDDFFFTEHHFQHEGYEVIPNSLLVGAALAERTERVNIGALFNIVPQWHPLRLAEDFATLHNLSGGRAILGVGRGTVPREAMPLGAIVGSTDDPVKRAEQDAINREMFDEAMDIMVMALDNEQFSFRGKHYILPPDGIPDRGGFVDALTLVPRPLYPYEIWQAVTSPPTLEYVPRKGWGGVWGNIHDDFLKPQWQRFADLYEQEHGVALGPGEKRMLVINVRVDDTREAALERGRPAHDEYWKFLAPYGRTMGYRMPDGERAPLGFMPTLEESVEQDIWLLGSPEDVAEGFLRRRDSIGATNMCILPACLGDPYESYDEQITRFAEQVLPLLS